MRGALSVLGEEYVELVMSSYEERWVDFAQNIGKSTGGFVQRHTENIPIFCSLGQDCW